jgi:hypothetical protein
MYCTHIVAQVFVPNEFVRLTHIAHCFGARDCLGLQIVTEFLEDGGEERDRYEEALMAVVLSR